MVYKVSELVQNLNKAISLSNKLSGVMIEGEIVGYKGPNKSGHIYFDLKDDSSIIKCMIFSSKCTMEYKEIIRDGAQVVLTGSLNYHQKFGLSFVFTKISETGEGARQRALLKLREELEELGMFDEMYKKPIPAYPHTVGLITSYNSAAIGDFLTNSKKYYPYIQVVVAYAKMEGDGAAESVVNAIKLMDEYGPDVIVLTRGGGSTDSLWTFNERIVAQAVFDCATPIVAAVGHDRDNTLVEDIADHFESTPTGAAIFLTENYKILIPALMNAPKELTELMNRQIKMKRAELKSYSDGIRYNSPANRLERRKKDLEKYKLTLNSSISAKVSECRRDLEKVRLRMPGLMNDIVTGRKQSLERSKMKLPSLMDSSLKKAKGKRDVYIGKLDGLSPIGRLNSGFSYLSDKDGKNVKSINRVKEGDELTIRVTDGEIISTVSETKKI